MHHDHAVLLREGTGQNAAAKIFQDLKLKHPPVLSIQVANALGLVVEFGIMRKYADRVVSVLNPKKRTILVNNNAPLQLINFSVARDIGKFVMDVDNSTVIPHDRFYNSANLNEIEATAFALELLAGKSLLESYGALSDVKEVVSRDPSLIVQMANWHLLPPTAMVMALKKLT